MPEFKIIEPEPVPWVKPCEDLFRTALWHSERLSKWLDLKLESGYVAPNACFNMKETIQELKNDYGNLKCQDAAILSVLKVMETKIQDELCIYGLTTKPEPNEGGTTGGA